MVDASADVSGRWAGQDGEGLVSTTFGVLLFLLLVLFAVQVTTHLYATTVVTTSAYDAVRRLAGDGAIGRPPAAAAPADPTPRPCLAPDPGQVALADEHLTRLLGSLYEPGATSWLVSDRHVEVRVAVRTPARLVGGVGAVAGLDRIERTVALERECFR